MKLGLNSYSYHLHFGKHPDFTPKNPVDVFCFLKRCVEIGFTGCHLDPAHLSSDSEEYIEQIVQFCQEHNLFIEYGTVGVEVEKLRKEIDKARALGAETLRTFVGGSFFDPQDLREKRLKDTAANLQVASQYAEEKGIRIAVENHGDFNSQELLQLIKEVNSPYVGICLDTGNWLMSFEDPVEASKKVIEYTFTTHFKDYRVQNTNYGMIVEGCPLGEGHIDIKTIYKLIRDYAPNCQTLTLEIPFRAQKTEEKSLRYEDEGIKKSYTYCREVLGVN